MPNITSQPNKDQHQGATEFLSSEELLIQLVGRLTYEKSELICALGKELTEDSEKTAKDFGARGHYKNLPGIFEINCRRNGMPHPMTGKGTGIGLKHFLWIPIIYKDATSEKTWNYVLSLMQEDLDLETANIHQNFFALQLTKTTGEGLEIGGESNSVTFAKGKYIYETGNSWQMALIHYIPGNSFPRAVRQAPSQNVYNDTKPWGYLCFEDEIPCMDLCSKSYNPKEVASFAMKLINHDILFAGTE